MMRYFEFRASAAQAASKRKEHMGPIKNGRLIRGTVKDYIHNLLSYLAQCLNKCDTYLVLPGTMTDKSCNSKCQSREGCKQTSSVVIDHTYTSPEGHPNGYSK